MRTRRKTFSEVMEDIGSRRKSTSKMSRSQAQNVVRAMKSRGSPVWSCAIQISEEDKIKGVRERVVGDAVRYNKSANTTHIVKSQVCTTKKKRALKDSDLRGVRVGGKTGSSLLSRIFSRVFSRRKAITR